jgi:Questin oxidase-like
LSTAKTISPSRYYTAYLEFFSSYILQHGMSSALEYWIFSPRANLGPPEKALAEEKQPRMLARFIAGVLHSIIHTGCAAELGIPGLMAEGLAECAVHNAKASPLFPAELFDSSGAFFQSKSRSASDEKQGKMTVFEILIQVYSRLHNAPPKTQHRGDFDSGIAQFSDAIVALARHWDLNISRLSDEPYLHDRIEQLVFLVVSIYGVSGTTNRANGQVFRADFFLYVSFLISPPFP